MQIFPKLYLTGTIVLDMIIMNCCYNTYGLSPDYNFFDTGEQTVYVHSVAKGSKAPFINNYAIPADNVISGMAIMDESISSGAVYADLRSELGKKLYIDDIHIQVPAKPEELDGRFELKPYADYAGSDEAKRLFKDDTEAAEVRIKKGTIYRLSSSEPCFYIDDVHIGMNISEVIRKWGEPHFAEHPVYRFPAGEHAEITLIASPDGYVTWMLYKSNLTELTEENTETGTEPTTAKVSRSKKDDREYPVAEAVMKLHGTHEEDGGK